MVDHVTMGSCAVLPSLRSDHDVDCGDFVLIRYFQKFQIPSFTAPSLSPTCALSHDRLVSFGRFPMGAMKRSRSETHSIASGRVLRSSKRASISNETFPCPYVGCGQAFSSQISLKRHIPEHNGDKPIRCSVRGCQERFASLSEKQSHLQDAHNIQMLSQATLRKRKARDPQALNLSSHISDDVEDDAAKLNADDPSASGPAPKNDGASHQSDDSEESVGALETEASDIAANATYLASQMKIARVRFSYTVCFSMCFVVANILLISTSE